MAERRKAALVVDRGKLVGIFGFKDMMTPLSRVFDDSTRASTWFQHYW
jgi:hypothetical protein